MENTMTQRRSIVPLQVDVIFAELLHRWVQLELGCTLHPDPQPEQANALWRGIEKARRQRSGGTLDLEAFSAWAIAAVPWLERQLWPPPAQPRRAWTPPPAPSVPAPTAAAAELARRIARSG
jgi:hypothetical protein